MALIDIAMSADDSEGFEVVRASENSNHKVAVPEHAYGHYEICKRPDGTPWELGRGAMGITYKAMDTYLGSPVALKVIAPQRLSSVIARERFLYEARTAAQLRHPNIATIHHLGKDEAVCFYAMECIEGETLEDRVQRTGPLPIKMGLSIALCCARALQMAHERRFIHRDLKPSNIMLADGPPEENDGAPLVKIIDFGLVKALSEEAGAADESAQVYFAGTPCYASPEQIEGREVDARADIFSLGRCLSFMLTGECPRLNEALCSQFEASPQPAYPSKKRREGVPDCVLALVASMTELHRGDRPSCAAEVVLAIQRCQTQIASPSMFRRWPAAVSLCLCALAALLILSKRTNAPASTSEPSTVLRHADVRLLCAQAEEARLKLTSTGLAQAIDLYSQAIAKAPDDADAHAGLSVAYFNSVARCGGPQSNLALAADHAQRAVALNPASPKGYQAQAAIQTFRGQPWGALTKLHRAIELDAKYAPAIRDFALLWNYVGRPQFTYVWAKHAAQLEPAYPFGWMVMGDAAADLGADEEAERVYRRVLSVNPSYLTAHCGLMHIHILEGEYAKADQDYELAASIDPESEFLLNLKAQNAFFHHDFPEATTAYEQLLSKNRSGLVSFYSGISYLSSTLR